MGINIEDLTVIKVQTTVKVLIIIIIIIIIHNNNSVLLHDGFVLDDRPEQ